MGQHSAFDTRSEPSTSAAPAPVGAPFFPPEEARVSATPVGGSVHPFPWVDDDHTPAPPISAETKLADAKDVVTWAFIWMSQDVEERLGQLEADLRATDSPSFGEQLLRAAFRTALSAATAGASEFLAGLVVGASDAMRELIKSAIENGVGEAIDLGADAFRGSREPLTAFIAAQRTAARYLYQRAQTRWLREGRHHVRTPAQADALATALTRSRVQMAAQFHYTASLDAWLSYLAQARFGVRHAKVMDEDYNLVEVGPSTNLASEEERERANDMGQDVDTDAPDLVAGFMGVADGVLTAEAKLPAIPMIANTGYYGMTGTPEITRAYLNGVNSIARSKYRNRPLSTMNIPRVVSCEVADGQTFTIRVNEMGINFHRGETPWLRARALAGRPYNMGKSLVELEQIGLDLLLADLVPTKILTGVSE